MKAVSLRTPAALQFLADRTIMEIMEVNLRPEVQAKLDDLLRETGGSADELIEAAVVSYVEEFARLREMLDRRYDDLASGRLKPIDSEDAFRRLMEKTEAVRRRSA